MRNVLLKRRDRKRSGGLGETARRIKKPSLEYEQLEPRLLLTVSSTPNTPLSAGASPIDVALAFIDGDAFIDMAVLGETGDLTVALNGGDDTWRDVQTTNLGLGALHGMQMTDVNADLVSDLVVQGPDTISLLLGDGTGVFVLSDTIAPGSAGTLAPVSGDRVGIEASHLDQTLVVDLAAVVPGTNEVLIFLNVVDGNLSTPDRYASGGNEPIATAIGNFVGEIFPDVAVGHTDGTVTFLEGLGDGSFQQRPDLSVTGLGTIRDVSTEDYDGDGDADLAVSGGASFTLLLNDDDLLTTSPIINGDFSNGLSGWTAEAVGQQANATSGEVNALGGFAQLVENESLLVSIHQRFQIPSSPESVSVDILSLALDDPFTGLADAFEISLLDDTSNTLAPTWRSEATSFFNVAPGGVVSPAAGVTFDGTTVSLDISALTPGTNATLYFDLVGNRPGMNSVAAVDNVRVAPAVSFTNSFTAVPLPGPFGSTAGISQGDVDGDGQLDLVLADSALDQLIVFNGDGHGSFTRSTIDVSTFGSAPFATDAARLTAADTADDVVVTLLDTDVVLTPLSVSSTDTSPPRVVFLDPIPGQLLTSDISQLRLRYSEEVRDQGPLGSHSVTNAAAYSLINAGANGVFEGGVGDDLTIGIASVTYDSNTFEAELALEAASLPLSDGEYQLAVEGDDPTLAIQDLSGNTLNGGADATMTFTVNTPPEILQIDAVEGFEGQSLDLLATFRDPGFLDSHTANVDWGDGTVTTATVNELDGTIRASHVFADNGTYVVQVALMDGVGSSDTLETPAEVANVPPSVVPSADQSAETGESLTLDAATFSDPGFTSLNAGTEETFTATIDWGDGTIEAGFVTVGQGSSGVRTTGVVHGEHSYANEGQYQVTVTVVDDDEGSGSAEFLVTVGDADPSVDVTDLVQVNYFGTQVNTRTRTVSFYGTITNTSQQTLSGPIHLSWSNMQPVTAVPRDADGTLDGGAAYFDITPLVGGDAMLEPGETSEARIFSVENPTLQPLSFDNVVTAVLVQAGSMASSAFSASATDQEQTDGVRLPAARFFVADAAAEAVFRYSTVGTYTGSFAVDSDSSSLRGATSDATGTYIWLIDSSSHQISVYGTDGNFEGSWQAVGLVDPQGIATDGRHIWIADAATDQVLFYENAAEHLSGQHTATATFNLAHWNQRTSGLVTDGTTLWVTDRLKKDPRVYVYDLLGNPLGFWRLPADNDAPSGITINLATRDLWVVDRDDDAAYRYVGAAEHRSGRHAFTGTITLASDNQQPEGIADPAMMINIGDVVADSISVAGEVDEWIFDATAGQQVFFDVQESESSFRWTLTNPNGVVVFTLSFADRDTTVLSETGQYTLAIEGIGASTGSYQFQLHDVPPVMPADIMIGDIVEGEIAVPGEEDHFTFDGTAGQQLYFDVQSNPGGGARVRGFTLLSPDGSAVFTRRTGDFDVFTLPDTGAYTLKVGDAFFLDDTGTYQFQIWQVPSPDVKTIGIGDIADGNIDTPGSTDEWQFNVSANQKIYLDFLTSSGATLETQLIAPDGSVVSSEHHFVLSQLDQGPLLLVDPGSYTFIVDGFRDNTGTYQF